MSSEKNETSFKQHVNSSIAVFTMVMLIFFIIKTFALYFSAKNSNKTANTLKSVSTFAIMAIFFLFSYFTNISATQEKIICGKRNYKIAFYATIIPFIFIYLIGIFFISIFPGWIRCFSNTFGSTFLNFSGLQSLIIDGLKESTTGNTSSNDIYRLYQDAPEILLNEIQLDDSGNISSKSKEQFNKINIVVNQNDTNEKLLRQYIYCKESIGEGIWHYLLGIITILASYNTILAENCNAFTIKKDDFRKYLNDKFQKN